MDTYTVIYLIFPLQKKKSYIKRSVICTKLIFLLKFAIFKSWMALWRSARVCICLLRTLSYWDCKTRLPSLRTRVALFKTFNLKMWLDYRQRLAFTFHSWYRSSASSGFVEIFINELYNCSEVYHCDCHYKSWSSSLSQRVLVAVGYPGSFFI